MNTSTIVLNMNFDMEDYNVDPVLQRLLDKEDAIERADADRLRYTLDDRIDPNRRVHAYDNNFEIVRYDRAGKWYREHRHEGTRVRLNLLSAVLEAIDCYNNGGVIRFGLPGGTAFDRKVNEDGVDRA